MKFNCFISGLAKFRHKANEGERARAFRTYLEVPQFCFVILSCKLTELLTFLVVEVFLKTFNY